jgi:mono/diheme cytochrome c family protein
VGAAVHLGAAVSLGVASALAFGCNAFEEAPPEGGRVVRLVPTDDRAAVQSELQALPVSGGTLLSMGPGGAVAVSDPARDRVNVGIGPETTEITLEKGSEPGRLAQIDGTQFAVVLRGSGEVAAFDTIGSDGAPEELWRTSVCIAPRGIDFELGSGLVHVACADGHLVSLDGETGSEAARVQLDSDLRDVVAADGRLYVSRFRSAEVLFVEDGEIARRVTMPTVNVSNSFGQGLQKMKPTVAWRMQAAPTSGVVVVHQRAALDTVGVDAAQDEEGVEVEVSPYGGSSGPSAPDCTAIVQTGISQVRADGARLTSPSLARVILPVDIAVSANGNSFAVANAGPADPDTPPSTIKSIDPDGFSFSDQSNVRPGSGVHLFNAGDMIWVSDADESVLDVGCVHGTSFQEGTPTTAVAFDGNDLVAQQPARAVLSKLQLSSGFDVQEIALGGESIVDTGHEIFHRDTGGGLACASCHPEGTDDGHVWKFEGLGSRRTQNLAVPLAETAPFHWNGELLSLNSLMDEVFVERMGGTFQSGERLGALQNWLFTAPQPLQIGRMNEAAERGKMLFESSSVGCATCHKGSALSDNLSYDVGTTKDRERLQVPSLVGVGAHGPFMHNGCAKTLHERFENPDCGGGDAHGVTSNLSPSEVDDMVEYLKTL